MNNEIVQWSLGSSTDWRDKVTDLLLRAARKNEVSALEKAMNEWTSVEDELPPSGVSVLIRYHDYYGRRRTVVGAHVRARTEEAGPYDDNGIYDEDLDCFWTKEGWYENQDNWGDYAMILFDPANKPQKWMRIPE